MATNHNSAKIGQQVFAYIDGEKVSGTYSGKRKINQGTHYVEVLRSITQDNGKVIETSLPIYNA